LERQLALSALDDLSYPEAGATRSAELPFGYRHDHYRERIGGPQIFDRAASGLRFWVAQKGAGVSIYPDDRPVALDSTILAILKLGPVRVLAPCRIIQIVESADTFGFTYGTLPGHPERGEEAFSVDRLAGGTFFSIVAFSRPAEPFVRAAGPIARRIQRTTTRGYIEALKHYAFSDLGTPT
jgi:uncharacterized protein (UPF0548 family)